MKINYDSYGRIDPSRIYLAKPNKSLICSLNSIDISSVDFTGNANSLSEITFNIYEYINKNDSFVKSSGYDLISKNMKILVSNIGWFVLDAPVSHHNGVYEYKEIHAYSAQKEYNQIPLDQWKVNKGTTDSLEMLVDGNVDIIDGVEFAKENIKFYNNLNPYLSLVDILVSKIPGWKVGYVDTIPKEYETIENGEVIKKQVLLSDEVGMFDVDYSDCYSFLIGDFEKYFNCIVEFDYLNFVVNFYRVENYGKNTNVVIGFRNVENTNDISVDDDNVFTKFRVAGGDDLGIEQFNGGSNYLIYISDYFLNEKYLSSSTIQKYKKWQEYCNNARYEYGEYSKQWNSLQDEITELNDRMPTSDCDPDNWSSLSDEELLSLKSDYEAEKLGYEKIYVDDNGDFDINKLNSSADANRYHQIVDTILPNIQIEIDNRELPTSEGEKDYLENYLTDWKYYGVNELEARLKSYQDLVNLLRKNHYDLTWEKYQELSSSDPDKYPVLTQEGFEDKHNEYIENYEQLNVDNIDSCAYALNQRKQEVDEKKKEQEEANNKRAEIGKKMDMSSFNEDGVSFLQYELDEITHLLNQTTYQNENIFVGSNESLTDTVTVQQKLCETALNDIVAYAIPQVIYNTTIDNLMAKTGSELHAHDLNYGNMIRFGIRDDYYVKLRVTQLNFNPCLFDNNLKIQFSNMIKTGKSRVDFISLLNLGNNLSKSSAQNTYVGDFKLTDENIYQILQKLLQSQGFKNQIGNIANGNGSGGGGGNYLTPGDIYGNNGFFEYIQAELIAAGKIVADSAEFKDLSALVAQIDNLLAGNVSAELGHIIELTAQNVKIDEAVIRDLIAANITVSMLKAGKISTNQFQIESDDGGIAIVGNTMQFKDKNDVVRIQIGRDNNNNFTFCLYDETGEGVLIDSTGIKKSAIADGTIVNDMISDGTIGKEKFNFNILEANEDGTIDVSKVTIDGEGLDAQWNHMESTVNNIQSQINNISTSVAYSINIYSTNGTVFRLGMIDTILQPILYHGQDNVTDDFDDSHFIWTRQSSDSDGDHYWNQAHLTGTKNLHITTADVKGSGTFTCSFYDDEGTLLAKSIF